jgi:hypothetical protein
MERDEWPQVPLVVLALVERSPLAITDLGIDPSVEDIEDLVCDVVRASGFRLLTRAGALSDARFDADGCELETALSPVRMLARESSTHRSILSSRSDDLG